MTKTNTKGYVTGHSTKQHSAISGTMSGTDLSCNDWFTLTFHSVARQIRVVTDNQPLKRFHYFESVFQLHWFIVSINECFFVSFEIFFHEFMVCKFLKTFWPFYFYFFCVKVLKVVSAVAAAVAQWQFSPQPKLLIACIFYFFSRESPSVPFIE